MLITHHNTVEKLLSTKVLKSISSMDTNRGTRISSTADTGMVAPLFGTVYISWNDAVYNFKVSLAGISISDMKVNIRNDGMVKVEGVVTGTSPANADEVRMQEVPPPVTFSISFYLPGPVDPRLTSFSYVHGILDGTVMRFRLPPYFPNGNH